MSTRTLEKMRHEIVPHLDGHFTNNIPSPQFMAFVCANGVA